MIYKKLKYLLIVLVSILLLLPLGTSAKDNGKNKRPVMAKTQATQIVTTRMDINNLNALEANNGYSDYNLNSNLEGTEYPKGSGKTAIFQSGFLWGGYVPGDAQVRVGGSAYRTGLQPGPIINGVAADPTSSKYSIYRVRPDVYPGGPTVDLSSDAALEGVSEATLLAQYQSDWTNWPVDLGAPYKDVNGDGKYDPKIDIPGVPGADQTIFYVANDLSTTQVYNLYGAKPLGLELHATFWAYAQSGALGNMYFKKWELINKGTNTIDSMFVSFWADVDLGASGDDLVGCDTTLSLQYCYNGQSTDAIYAPLPPPADGFDFFQGPIVAGSASDVAIFNGKYRPGYRNLPMTAAYFFVNGDANFGDPPQGDPSGSTQFYHFFNGEYGLSGTPFIDNVGNLTKFAFSGDPVTQTGWIDGVALPAGDRRQGMASGPFTLAPNDTQEVVVAEVFAGAIPSVNYLQAITLLKTYDKTAQNAYDHFFNLPSPPPAPKVTVVASNNKVVLDWGENLTAVNATENSNIADQIDSVDASGGGSYTFEGYNVYQFPYRGASKDVAKLLATYDLVDGVTLIPYTDPATREVEHSISIQNGTDSGIKRSIVVTTDAFNSNKPLNNGTPYYFAVTAFSYNPKGVPQSLENPISMVSVIPQNPNPGVSYTYNVGDTIVATHSAGVNDGSVIALVVDPTKLTGDQYKVTFDTTGGSVTWKLTDITKNNTVVLSGQKNQSGDENYSYVSGMQVKVLGPENGIKGNGAAMVETVYGGTALTTSQYDAAGKPYGGNTVWHSLNSAQSERYFVSAGGGDGGLDRLIRDQVSPYNYKIVFTDTNSANPSYGLWYFDNNEIGKVPVEMWKFDPITGDSVQLIPLLYTGGAGNAGYFQTKYTDVYFGYPATDWIYWYDGDYASFETACKAGDANTALNYPNNEYFSRMTFGDYDGDNKVAPPGTVIKIITTKPNTMDDQFTFFATAPSSSTALAKKDVNSINVFPNPYYGVNSQETYKYAKFVTFNHLPATATIRIFNLAGIQVRVINHTDGTQFQQWDLTNDSGLPVASGLYIVYIDMPTIGATKILKAAIIQEQQFPDHF